MCIFCDIVSGKAPASRVFSDGLVTAFMDVRPVNPGHLLVVPDRHSTGLRELDPATAGRMFQVGQLMAGALYRSGLPCEGVNLFLADGEAAGQEVFHVHLHVFPRYKADGFGLVFSPRYYQSPPARDELDQLAAQIRSGIDGPWQDRV